MSFIQTVINLRQRGWEKDMPGSVISYPFCFDFFTALWCAFAQSDGGCFLG